MRGDVRSDAALVYQMFSGRLYRLVREAIRIKMTTAAWPVWGAMLNAIHASNAEVQRRALCTRHSRRHLA